MILSIVFTHLWGVLQLIALGSFTRTAGVLTICSGIAAGLYGCMILTALLQLSWTKPAAWITSIPFAQITEMASYTLDPFIEEGIKILPLVLLLKIPTIRRQWSLTDCILLGAALGSGFGLAESIFRFSTVSPRAHVSMESFGWVIRHGLSSLTVFSPSGILTSWLPESVSAGSMFVSQETPKQVNLHLAWSALAGLGVGLFFQKERLIARRVGIALLLYVSLDHAANNADITIAGSWLVEAFTSPFRMLRNVLWLMPIVALFIAWKLDRRRLGDSISSHAMLKAEKEIVPRWKGTVISACTKLPWSLPWVIKFVRIRRAYKMIGVNDNPLSPVVTTLRNGIDLALSPQVHVPLVPASLTGDTLLRILKRPVVVIGIITLIPAILWFGVGGYPQMAWVQHALIATPVWISILLLSVLSLGWMARELYIRMRQWHLVAGVDLADPIAIYALRLFSGAGALVLGAYAALMGLAGSSPLDKLLRDMHLLNALSSGPVLTGLLLALLALALVLLLPEILAALGAIGDVLMVYGLISGLSGKDLLTGRQLKTWERILNLLPGLLEALALAGRGIVGLAELLSELAADARSGARIGETAEGAVVAAEGASEAASAASSAPGAVKSLPPEWPEFNPAGHNTNCGACADAVDNYLAGKGFNSAGNVPFQWPKNTGAFADKTVPGIETALGNAGDGARGVVYVTDGANGHVFNVVNNGGKIVAIDGQTGVYGSIQEVAEYAGYPSGTYKWAWTYPKP